MGIEPTDHVISTRPDGFEDRGLHQQSKHFRIVFFDTYEHLRSFLKSAYTRDTPGALHPRVKRVVVVVATARPHVSQFKDKRMASTYSTAKLKR